MLLDLESEVSSEVLQTDRYWHAEKLEVYLNCKVVSVIRTMSHDFHYCLLVLVFLQFAFSIQSSFLYVLF